MSLTAGIVGLPNVGKSTLFNAITKQNILAANYPFATIEPNIGTVLVPDKRLNELAEIYQPQNVLPTTFEFTDIAGLVKGASKGEGLGNQFLSHIREVDAICHVVRCYDDPNVVHVEGAIDPKRDVEIINLELIFADLDIIEKRLARIEKKAYKANDKEAIKEVEILKKLQTTLMTYQPIRSIELTEEEQLLIKSFSLLTNKPVIYLANVKEDEIHQENNYVIELKKIATAEKSDIILISAKIESEIATLDDEDRSLFLEDLGLSESGLDQVIRAAYHVLGLATYFTAGEKEVRAWTFKTGMKAPSCAGIIHTDFEKGFIKAEVLSYEDLILYRDEKIAKEHGKLRLEGKDYVMQDGDICHFRFNV